MARCKIQELGYVGITSAILASLFASAFTWPLVPADAYATQGCWYGGLILILGSIATATQQSITLHRFSVVDSNWEDLRKLLGKDQKARPIAIYVWQLPVMMLRFGIIAFCVGMFLFLWRIAPPVCRDCSESNLKVFCP